MTPPIATVRKYAPTRPVAHRGGPPGRRCVQTGTGRCETGWSRMDSVPGHLLTDTQVAAVDVLHRAMEDAIRAARDDAIRETMAARAKVSDG